MDTTMVVLLVVMGVLFIAYIGRRRARLKDED